MDQNTIVAAVLAIVNGAVAVPIVQLLKSWLHINGGFQAYLLTFAEVAAITAGYLLLAPGMTFTWPVFLISTFYAFLQASKIYDDMVNKKPA
jgi:urea transporter